MGKINKRTSRLECTDSIYARERREALLVPPPMAMLRSMIDGHYDVYSNEIRNGTGQASINCSGGWGWDIAKKLVDKGWITIHRKKGNTSCFGGSNTINKTIATVTETGIERYNAWKRRNRKILNGVL